MSSKLVAMDTEKDGSGGLGQWSIAFRDDTGRLCVVPSYGTKDKKHLEATFAKSSVVFHNYKYDARELKANGMPVPLYPNIHDTLIQGYCLGLGKQAPKDEAKSKSGSDMVGGLGLKYLARRHLGMQMNTWKEVAEQPELVPEYNAKDSVATFLLAEKWLPILPKHYFEIDMPLLPVLMKMEDRGIMIDVNYLKSFAEELDSQLAEFDLPLNPYSPKQIGKYVYETLGIEPWRFTSTGQPSTEEEVLETIDDPVVKQILAYKRLYKEKGTYVESYIKGRDSQDKIHPEFKQTSTSTGRLSCARPNLQNVFKRDDRVKLRSLFVAPPGRKLIRADYNQLDFRALAAITQDPILIDALNADKKIHQVTAELMGLSYDDAKTVNFGVLFGQEAWSLSQQLHITIGEARDFLRDYFKRFPNIKKYRDEYTEIIQSQKKVSIPFTGRTRRIDAMYVEQKRIQREGLKEGLNLPVQGLEAEVVKIGMIDLDKLEVEMVLQVHDELIIEVEEGDALEFAHWLKEYIPTIVEFGGMTFPVEVGIGDSWYEAMNNEI
jgi:DNA polymerase-1